MTSARACQPSIRVLRRGDVDADVRARWDDLAEASSGTSHSNVFFGPDLLLAAWDRLADGRAVELLVVERKPEPDQVGDDASWALAVPIAAADRPWRHPVRARSTWQHSQAFLGSPLAREDATEAEWEALLRGVRDSGADSWIATALDGASARRLEAAASNLGLPTCRFHDHRRAVTRRRERDDYAQLTVSGKNRKELRRLRRRLATEAGAADTVDLARDASPADVRAAARLFLDLESSGWKGEDGGAMAVRSEEALFFEDACEALAARGDLQLLSLRTGSGEPAAMAVNIRAGRTLSTWKIAYDERFATYSPGVQLTLDGFAAFHESGADLLDSCAVPGHVMAERLHADRRRVATVAVGLGSRRGALLVRTMRPWLRLHDRVRPPEVPLPI